MILTPWNKHFPVYGGADLSSTTDLTAFAMVQRREDMEGWNANWLFWLPEETAEAAERKDNVPYTRWEQEGFLNYTPGARIRHEFVRRDIIDACLEHDIGFIGYDPWNAEWLQAQLEEEGLQCVQVRQGYASLSEPSKHFEAAVAEGTFRHGGNPVAGWMAENCEVQTDVNGNIRPVKPEHGSNKRIDGIVATIIAISVAIECGDDGRESMYEHKGSLSL